MKQLITSIFLFLFIGKGAAFAFTCNLNILFTTQAEIDNFPSNYPNCTDITGFVRIEGIVGSDITNLDGLSGITSIGGYLRIRNCPLLENIDGLNGLTSVGDELRITNCPLLTDIDALNNLTFVGSMLIIGGCSLLEHIDGLNALTGTGLIEIGGNESLTSIDGFNGLTSNFVAPIIQIHANNSLTSITGFGALTDVWYLYISQNFSLAEIAGFNALATASIFGSGIIIQSNDALTNISGLSNVTSAQHWSIAGNYNLSACSIQSVCDHIAAANPVSIWDNAPGCMDEVEVALYCTGPCAVIPNIVSNVQALGLPNGLTNALLAKLNNAIASFQNGNANAGVNKLNAFINQVNAHSGGNITEEDAAALIAQAQSVISTVENGGNTDCTQPLIALPGPGILQPGKAVRRGAGPSVFPNPARGSAIVHLGELAGKQGAVQLFDQQGRAVWQAPLETLGVIHRLDVSDFAAGMYFLRVQPEGEVGQTVKLVVEVKE